MDPLTIQCLEEDRKLRAYMNARLDEGMDMRAAFFAALALIRSLATTVPKEGQVYIQRSLQTLIEDIEKEWNNETTTTESDRH